MKSLIAALLLIPTSSFAAASPLTTQGKFENELVFNQEIKALDEAAVTAHSWDRSEDLRGASPTGAIRFETRETSDRHSDRIFFEIDPKTAQTKILFAIDDTSLIKRWTENANGIHLYYCYYADEQEVLVQTDIATGERNELGSDCANQSIPLPNGDYWSFYRNAEDPKRRAGFLATLPPLYANFKPIDTSKLPKSPVFEPEKISLSSNGKFLTIQALEYGANGTYVYDIQNRSIVQFKSAVGAGYSRAVASNDGKLVSGYVDGKAGTFSSQFLALLDKDSAMPVIAFNPTLRQDQSDMFDFSDAQFSLDDSKVVVTASSHTIDPYSNDNRRDVDVFDTKTGAHLLRLQRSWIAKNLDHDRVLIQSWANRSFSILDLSKPVPVVTHIVTYPLSADPYQTMHATFAGNDLVLTFVGKSYIYDLGNPGEI